MSLKKGEHIEIRCDKCKHRIRYHAKGQFGCVVPKCNCTSIEPVEVIVQDADETDIITIKEDGTVIS